MRLASIPQKEKMVEMKVCVFVLESKNMDIKYISLASQDVALCFLGCGYTIPCMHCASLEFLSAA
jgi:hypothetical protein